MVPLPIVLGDDRPVLGDVQAANRIFHHEPAVDGGRVFGILPRQSFRLTAFEPPLRRTPGELHQEGQRQELQKANHTHSITRNAPT